MGIRGKLATTHDLISFTFAPPRVVMNQPALMIPIKE